MKEEEITMVSNNALALAIKLAIGNSALQLVSVVPSFEWENGRPSDRVNGTTYTVLLTALAYEKIEIATKELTPVIRAADLDQAQTANRPMFVNFSGLSMSGGYIKDKIFIAYFSAEKASIAPDPAAPLANFGKPTTTAKS
jgi:hypothetical protein